MVKVHSFDVLRRVECDNVDFVSALGQGLEQSPVVNTGSTGEEAQSQALSPCFLTKTKRQSAYFR
jgi:hypothetical protein